MQNVQPAKKENIDCTYMKQKKSRYYYKMQYLLLMLFLSGE